MKPDPGEVGAEPGLRARDPEVRSAGKAKAASDRRALHRSDHRDGRLEEAQRLLVQLPRAPTAGQPRAR
jgi:hypothetical protein